MDSYATYLSNVQKKTSVVATEDICNSNGQLIVRKGVTLDNATTDRIVKFKLLKPLDQCVVIEGELTAQVLQDKISKFASKGPILRELHSLAKIDDVLEKCCVAYASFPMLRQKVTVMELELPKPFEAAIFSAWMSVLILNEMGKEFSDIQNGFIAALIHDIGFLHIDPAIFKKEGSLTVVDLKQVHVHPIIGKKIVDGITGIPKVIGTAILEHHENLDGTGYPAAKSVEPFNDFGRLIHLLDAINGIYVNQLRPAGRTLWSVIPILQMNYYLQRSQEFAAYSRLIKNTSCSTKCFVRDAEISDVVSRIYSGHAYIQRFLATRKDMVNVFGQKHNNPRLFSIQNAYLKIYNMMVASGLMNESYLRWLEQVKTEAISHAYSEADDCFFMIKEVIYQIRGIKNQALVFFDDPNNLKFLNVVPDIITKINMDDTCGTDF